MISLDNRIFCGDAKDELRSFPNQSVNCVVTSPPYWNLRDYGISRQIGLEETVEEYLAALGKVFEEVYRVLADSGTCWVNMGDVYIDKKLYQIPARFALRMAKSGWILRNEIIWHKPNGMPCSVTDRFGVDFEKIFFFVKSQRYYFDMDAVREPHGEDKRLQEMRRAREYGYDGKGTYQDWYNNHRQKKDWVNKKETGEHRIYSQAKKKSGVKTPHLIHPLGRARRCVWMIPTSAYKDAHFAVFPSKLIEPCILAGCPQGRLVLDPFMGSGTTAAVAQKLGRKFVGVELNPEYIRLAEKRLCQKFFEF